jgi:hypothetical protein
MISNTDLQWEVSSNQAEYKRGDKVQVTASLRSMLDKSLKLTINSMLQRIDDKEFPLAIIPTEVQLESKKSLELPIRQFEVTDELPPGEYLLKIALQDGRETLGTNELHFTISGTLSRMDFTIQLSHDEAGKEQRKVFTLEDKIAYIAVQSDVSEISFSAILQEPKKQEHPLSFSENKAKITLDEEGNYTLIVSAQAPGYHALTKRAVFSVIKNVPEFGKLNRKNLG